MSGRGSSRFAFTQVPSALAEARSSQFVAAHEGEVKESVGADVLGGPQPQNNEKITFLVLIAKPIAIKDGSKLRTPKSILNTSGFLIIGIF